MMFCDEIGSNHVSNTQIQAIKEVPKRGQFTRYVRSFFLICRALAQRSGEHSARERKVLVSVDLLDWKKYLPTYTFAHNKWETFCKKKISNLYNS